MPIAWEEGFLVVFPFDAFFFFTALGVLITVHLPVEYDLLEPQWLTVGLEYSAACINLAFLGLAA